MNTRKLWVFLGVFALLLVSCEEEEKGRPRGDTQQFWVLDYRLRPHSIEAELRAKGKYSNIWVERGLPVEDESLSRLAWEYDNRMRPALDVFSMQTPVADQKGRIIARNSLELADSFGDGDGKLAILIADIPAPGAEFMLAGYFYPGDFFSKDVIAHSNEADIIYVNVHLGVGSAAFHTTLVHEMQHLMNFANTVQFKSGFDSEGYLVLDEFDLWINEGLSAAAEYVYSGMHNEARLERFNDPDGDNGNEIFEGNNFFIWGERPDKILDEYATVYLFFQWLRLQAGGTDIYREISNSELSDYRAVLHSLRGKGNYRVDTHLSWETLLGDWMLANLMTTDNFERFSLGTRSNSPKHSYMKDPFLSTIRPSFLGGTSAITLLPGEGVYSYTRDRRAYPANNNIRYTGAREGPVAKGESIAGGYLLTYNINPMNQPSGGDYEHLREWAQISADIPPAGAFAFAKNAEPVARPPAKPQAISLWDMLNLQGDKTAYAPFVQKLQSAPED